MDQDDLLVIRVPSTALRSKRSITGRGRVAAQKSARPALDRNGSFAQIAVIAKRWGERVKSTLSAFRGPSFERAGSAEKRA